MPADADRADDLAGGVADENSARDGNEVAAGQGGECADEMGVRGGAGGDGPAADAEVQGAAGLGLRDVLTYNRLDRSSRANATSRPAASSTATVIGGSSRRRAWARACSTAILAWSSAIIETDGGNRHVRTTDRLIARCRYRPIRCRCAAARRPEMRTGRSRRCARRWPGDAGPHRRRGG